MGFWKVGPPGPVKVLQCGAVLPAWRLRRAIAGGLVTAGQELRRGSASPPGLHVGEELSFTFANFTHLSCAFQHSS